MKTKTLLRSALALALTLTLAGLARAADAPDNWKTKCAMCHGADGSGQTPVGKKLKLKDYTSADAQAKMTDEEILKAITDGVTEDGKSRMPAFKDRLTPDEIKALAARVRSLKK
jgi:mono/diheme cytochrome c family protein